MSKNPFRYFKTSPEIIRRAVMKYIRFPMSFRNVEDLLHERGIEITDETQEKPGQGKTGTDTINPENRDRHI
jgi:transposase-like protein